MTRTFAWLLLLVLMLCCLWLTRHAWLTYPTAYQINAKLSSAVGLPTLAASRADALTLASHAKLANATGSRYDIHGQLYNPLNVPLARPSIRFVQLDRDNQVLQHKTYQPSDWATQSSSTIPSKGFADFVLPVLSWPSQSWGYRIELIDAGQ